MRERLQERPSRAVAIWLAALVVCGCSGASAVEKPRVIPLPAPPHGPEIRRVTHDAPRAVHPGDRVSIKVLSERDVSVLAAIGSLVAGIRCAPQEEDLSVYTCEAEIPPGSEGKHHVRARATGADGRSTELSAALPVVVERVDAWGLVNALNARIELVLFAAGSDGLDAGALAAVEAAARLIETHPSLSVVIEGHCDSEEEGDHRDLSLRRAEAVLKRLGELGIPADRMSTNPLGAAQPLSASRTESERALNRRVVIAFEPHPGGTAP